MDTISRRFLAPSALATAAVAATAAPAEARKKKRKKQNNRWNKTPVPTPKERHYGNRFAYGITPKTLQAMRKAGSAEAWFNSQLYPNNINESKLAKQVDSWWPDLYWSWDRLLEAWKKDNSIGWITVTNHVRWSLAKRIYSNRSVLESMADFWENYINIPVQDDSVFFFRANYGRAIRAQALESFEEILYTAITHPAMSLALDNASSHKNAPNENLGRELLELYTVGHGQYDENDVKNSAKILTGWTVAAWQTWEPKYRNDYHYVGKVKVMGFTHANNDADGRQVTKEYLKYLAHHPATARKIARALIVRFVSDEVSESLVNTLAQTYLKNNTEIRPVLKALVASVEFKNSAGKKTKTPADEIVSLYRAMSAKMTGVSGDDSAANQIIWSNQYIGTPALSWPRPDAPPDDAVTWSTAGRMFASFEVHWGMAGSWWPNKNVVYKKPHQWIPQENMRFDQLVDHLSRVILGEKASKKTLAAACKTLEMSPKTRVTKDSSLYSWRMPYLLAVFLDSPRNFTR